MITSLQQAGREGRQGMTRLPSLHRDELNEDAIAIWDRITRMQTLEVFTADGGPSGPFNAFLHAPPIGGRLAELGTPRLTRTADPRRSRELMVSPVGAQAKAGCGGWARRQR